MEDPAEYLRPLNGTFSLAEPNLSQTSPRAEDCAAAKSLVVADFGCACNVPAGTVCPSRRAAVHVEPNQVG